MAVNAKARETRSLIWLKGPGDFTYADVSVEDTTNTTWTDCEVEITIDPPTSRDYLILAAGELARDSVASTGEIRLYDVTNSIAYNSVLIKAVTTDDYRPWQCVLKVTISSSTTFKIQYKSTSADTTYIRNKSILALDLTEYPDVFYDEQRTAASTTSTSWTDTGNTLTDTLDASDGRNYLIFAGLHCRGATLTTFHGEVRLLLGASSFGENQFRTQHATNDAWIYYICYMSLIGSGSQTLKFQFRKQGTGFGGLSVIDSAIAVLKLEDTKPFEVPKDEIIRPQLQPFINRSEVIESIYIEEEEIYLDYEIPSVVPKLIPITNRTISIISPYQEPTVWDPSAGIFTPSMFIPAQAPEPIVPQIPSAPINELWATASPFTPYYYIEHQTKYGKPIGGAAFAKKDLYIGTYDPTNSSFTLDNANIYYIPLIVPIPIYIIEIGIVISIIDAGTQAYLGIYSSENGEILDKIYENTISLNTVGYRMTPAALSLAPGFYFIALLSESSSVSVRKAEIAYSMIPYKYPTDYNVNTCYKEIKTFAEGLPDTAGDYEPSSDNIPRVVLRI